uniref:ATP-dependent DNA helicase n=1 Tax=Octopus bimaculoides TaxID=37653 RepID=A0A0L8IDQ2_OCTBM
MPLRNLGLPKLCNGTRIIIKKMMPAVLETTTLTGKASSEPVFIPRIPLFPSNIRFQCKRLQLLLKLSFAMSINKAQGQPLDVVGLNLAEPVFSHGQPYAGFSRVGNLNHSFIYVPQGKTKNVV